MKTKEEIIKRLEEIDDCIWTIDMIDHWQLEDRAAYDRLVKEKKELEKELEKIENETGNN